MMMVSSTAHSNLISRLPGEIFESQIIPLLLDIDHPESIAILSRVCKQWQKVMKSDFPYKAKMSEPKFIKLYPDMAAIGTRKAYLSRYPSTLSRKMYQAYKACRENTSLLEAKFLFPAILGLPSVLPATDRAIVWVLSNLPVDVSYDEMSINIPVLLSQLFATAAMWAIIIAENTTAQNTKSFDTLFSIAASVSLASVSFVLQFEGDSALSKTYRVGKATLAASVPLIKEVGSRIRRAIRSSKFSFG